MSKQHDATGDRLPRWAWIVVAPGLIGIGASALHAAQTDIAGPPASLRFGSQVAVLANGNFVVVDADGPVSGVGSVHLYAADGSPISTLTGASANDHIGSAGIVVLPGGQAFVVVSPLWDNSGASNAGAVTWIDGTTGLGGLVTAANSLVGTQTDDFVGSRGVTVLSNGNYVVASPLWDNGANADVGAVSWGSGTGGSIGPVSSANSLLGTTANDRVGNPGVTALSNGNYVVASAYWDHVTIADVGAVTWANGASGSTGYVSSANSLVGSSTSNFVGSKGVTALSNGNYVVASPSWDNGATADVGAVTWANGASSSTGSISTINSLVGTSTNDRVGNSGVTALANGNYVVASDYWNNGATTFTGAVTWGDGTGGSVGPVSAANSLVGASTGDFVGNAGVTALSNGNYVVASYYWNNGATTNVGAVTWGNGTSGSTGFVSSTNSLVGTSASDQVGSLGVTALSDGNYVVASSTWDNGPTADVGAVTWGNGAGGSTGPVTSANSLVGTAADDQVGNLGVTALGDGNYVVPSNYWDNGATVNVGAITWCRAGGSTIGPVTALNSRIGMQTDDKLGSHGATAYPDGNYVVASGNWNNGGASKAGAVSLANGGFRLSKHIEPWNSVLGSIASGGPSMSYAYDPVRHRLIVGRPAENIVSLFTMDQLFADGMEP